MNPVLGCVVRVFGGVLLLGSLVRPALSQVSAAPGSTINGSVPHSEGNVWNGLDHQPTPGQTAAVTNPHQQAQVSHTLSKLDRQLLNDPLPPAPAGAPQVDSR